MAHYPIFDRFEVWEIAQATGYRVGYVDDIRRRNKPATEIFRLKCAKAFQQPEEVLFGTPVEAPHA